ncbi:hypothetical protein V6N13_081607 [Hibiscus sabdariffa]
MGYDIGQDRAGEGCLPSAHLQSCIGLLLWAKAKLWSSANSANLNAWEIDGSHLLLELTNTGFGNIVRKSIPQIEALTLEVDRCLLLPFFPLSSNSEWSRVKKPKLDTILTADRWIENEEQLIKRLSPYAASPALPKKENTLPNGADT